MADLSPESRQRAEEAASCAIDDVATDETDDVVCLSDGRASDGPAPRGDGERTLYLRHLFVHGLMESLADETSGAARDHRERLVTGVMEKVNTGRPAGRVVRRHSTWRSFGRPVAAAAAVLVIVVGALAVFTGRGQEARATVRFALQRVDDGLDREYHGKTSLVFRREGQSVERSFESEFISRGRDRYYAMLEFPGGPWGVVPLYFGRLGEHMWFNPLGMGPRRVRPETMGPGGRRMGMDMGGNPFDAMTNLGTLLDLMGRHCELKWAKEGDEGPLRVVGTPTGKGEFPMPGLERILLEIDPKGHEVQLLEMRMKPRDEMQGLIRMLVDVPKGAECEAVVMRLQFVKSYQAPDSTYWPKELGDPDAEEESARGKSEPEDDD